MADMEPSRLPVPLLDGERAQEHDDLTREASEILRAWIAKRAIICNHTQVLEYPEAADELMKVFGARISELRDQYDQAFAALQRRTDEWQAEQAARVNAEQATIAADQRAQRAEAELALAMGPTMYLQIQQILDGVLGGRREDGAGAGLVAEIQLLADRMRQAQAERDEVLAEMREEARTADELRRNRDQLADQIQNLKDRVTELSDLEAGIKSLTAADGSIDMDLHIAHDLMRLYVAAFAEILNADDAPNFVEMAFKLAGTTDRYTVTVRRPKGETPGEILGKTQAERDTAQEEVAWLRAALKELDVKDEDLHQAVQRIKARRRGREQSERAAQDGGARG